MKFTTKRNILLAILGLSGSLMILLSTSRYGAGVSPDSVGYFEVAESMRAGNGAFYLDGSPMVAQPPLYPSVLALAGAVFQKDPEAVAHYVNAVLFGLIIFLTGLLISGYVSSLMACCAGAVWVLACVPLYQASVMAWAEPLFILLVLFFLLLQQRYDTAPTVWVLALMSCCAALACLTRYIGITVLFCGAAGILFARQKLVKEKLFHAGFFLLLASIPSCLWTARNIFVSGTAVGQRAPSMFTLYDNLHLTLDVISFWYFPGSFRDRMLMLVSGAIIGILLCRGIIIGPGIKSKLREVLVGPPAVFALVYTAFLIAASSFIAYDGISHRLLAPLFVPLLVVVLAGGALLGNAAPGRGLLALARLCFWAYIFLWAGFELKRTCADTLDCLQHGAGGYATATWHESETIKYIRNKNPPKDMPIYSNAVDVVYFFLHRTSRVAPAQRMYNSNKPVQSLAELTGAWPPENEVYLLWFKKITRPHLFSVEELKQAASIEEEAAFPDGVIYRARKK